MIIDKFVYNDLRQVACQVYMIIHDWIKRGEFSFTDFSVESNVVCRLDGLLWFYRPTFTDADQFESLINCAIAIPEYKNMLEKVDPSYKSFTGDKGSFVYRFIKLLFQEILHKNFDEFKTLWVEQRKRIRYKW